MDSEREREGRREKKKVASAGCHPDISLLLCGLCPVCGLCDLFWCFNLSQVNNILCCLKLCVRLWVQKKKKESRKGLLLWFKSTCLWLFPLSLSLSLSLSRSRTVLPSLALSFRLPDKVIIRCCFLPAITFGYNGSSAGKAAEKRRRGLRETGRDGSLRRHRIAPPSADKYVCGWETHYCQEVFQCNASTVISLEYIWASQSLLSYRAHIVSFKRPFISSGPLFVFFF